MLLYYGMVVLHVVVCLILVLVVLLQSGKGADLAGAFGGGATQTAFGSRGPASFLSKLTTIAAIVFMLTSLGLAGITTRREAKSVLETGGQQKSQPVKKSSAPTTAPTATPTQEQIRRRVEELEKQKAQQQQAAPATNQAKPEQPASKPADSK